jgi:hypothetical protein
MLESLCLEALSKDEHERAAFLDRTRLDRLVGGRLLRRPESR